MIVFSTVMLVLSSTTIFIKLVPKSVVSFHCQHPSLYQRTSQYYFNYRYRSSSFLIRTSSSSSSSTTLLKITSESQQVCSTGLGSQSNQILSSDSSSMSGNNNYRHYKKRSSKQQKERQNSNSSARFSTQAASSNIEQNDNNADTLMKDHMEDDDDNDMETTTTTPTYPKFESINELHPVLQSNLNALQLTTMTEIQYKTWSTASMGQDVLGRARTGTGKTVAFLLPALQQLLLQYTNTNDQQQQSVRHTKIQMLVLSPTRELAAQIHDQGLKLTRTKNNIISHHVMYGGNSKNNDIKQIEQRIPTILVSTPGRLKDHIENTVLFNGSKSFKSLLSQVQILVLDETDRLLDMGFKRDVEAIISHIPTKDKRQTLLFSATIPNEVQSVIKATMRPNYITVDCIHDTDPASHTNAQVSQTHVIVPVGERMVSGTVDILCKLISDTKAANEPLKLVVFFNTAHLVAFYAALFNALPKHLTHHLPIYELHSRKSQAFRTRTALAFKNDNEAILFTSDVSARGVDYPGVTDVVQFGIPDTRESYIHRLGRTGRAGKQGEGLIVLTNMEEKFLQQLKGLDVPVNKPYQTVIDNPSSTPDLDRLLEGIGNGQNEDLAASASSAYRSMLGFYNGKLRHYGYPGPEPLINFANMFAKQVGFNVLPEIEMQTIKKMGLTNYVGLNVVYKASNRAGGAGRGEYGRGKSGGQGGGGRGGPARGRGGPSGRGDGGGTPRYMSTDTRPAVTTSHVKRTMTDSDNQRRDNQSAGPTQKKKARSNDATTTDGTSKPIRRRRPAAGRGERLSNV